MVVVRVGFVDSERVVFVLPVAGHARDVGAPEDEMPDFLALDLYTSRPRTADSFGIAIGDLDGLGID
jgi:hypothetical protein